MDSPVPPTISPIDSDIIEPIWFLKNYPNLDQNPFDTSLATTSPTFPRTSPTKSSTFKAKIYDSKAATYACNATIEDDRPPVVTNRATS